MSFGAHELEVYTSGFRVNTFSLGPLSSAGAVFLTSYLGKNKQWPLESQAGASTWSKCFFHLLHFVYSYVLMHGQFFSSYNSGI